MKRLFAALLLAAALPASAAWAGGYDTPIMYSARHMGMGGTAIGYVNDPSAAFHNPAGFAHTDFFSATLDFSPLVGGLTTSPAFEGQNKESNLTFAPFFLGAASIRVTDFLTLGFGVYPVASSGAGYDYKNAGNVSIRDFTKIAFIEAAPGLAVNLPLGFKLGAVWRATMIQFTREQYNPESKKSAMFDMELGGASFEGYRVGLQWDYIPGLSVGVVYRSKTETVAEGDSGSIVMAERKDISMPFILPAKLGFGVRGDLGVFAAALDLEWGFYSQNESVKIKATSTDGSPFELTNYYKWQDALTARVGLEWTFLPLMKARVGYVMDGKTGNENYPSAFGTPPVATHSITAGFGISLFDFVETNLAYAYRFGSTTVGAPAEGTELCLACSKPGEYSIGLHGFYIDAGIKL